MRRVRFAAEWRRAVTAPSPSVVALVRFEQQALGSRHVADFVDRRAQSILRTEESSRWGRLRRDLQGAVSKGHFQASSAELEQWDRVKRAAALDAAHRPGPWTADLLEGQFAEFLTEHSAVAEAWDQFIAERYRLPPSWGLLRRPRDGMLYYVKQARLGEDAAALGRLLPASARPALFGVESELASLTGLTEDAIGSLRRTPNIVVLGPPDCGRTARVREILAEHGVPFSYRPQVAAAADYDSSVRHLFATLRDWSGAWPVVVAGGRRYAPSGPRVRASPCSAILSGLG